MQTSLRFLQRLLILTFTIAVPRLASPAGVPLTIVHVNDTHSALDSHGDRDENLQAHLGGIARAATAIGHIRAASLNVLAVDAGDLMHGTEFFNAYFGVPEFQLLEQLGFDVMAVGNHEFDFGPDFLAMVLSQSGPVFPLVCANLDLSGYPLLKNWIQPRIIKTIAGVRVGIFGMVTPDDFAYRPAPAKILGAADPATVMEIAGSEAATLRAMGADVVILLSHLGDAYDRAVGANVPGIDVIVGGHSHAPTDGAVLIPNPLGGETIYVRAGSVYRAVGKLSLMFENGKVSLVGWDDVILDQSVPQEPSVQAVVESLKDGIVARYGDLYHHAITYSLENTDDARPDAGSPRSDSPLGDLIADSYRFFTGTQIAITPVGLYGGPLYRGPIVGADAFGVTSYGFDEATGLGFRLATFDITGSELVKALEVGLAVGDDLFMQVSGMRFRFDSTAPSNAKIDTASIRIDGRPWSPTATYSVTVNEGSAQMLSLVGATVTNLTFLPEFEFNAFRNYLDRRPVLIPMSWGRIWDTSRQGK